MCKGDGGRGGRDSSATVWNQMLANVSSLKVTLDVHERAKHLPRALWRRAPASRYEVAAHACDGKSPGALRGVASQRLQMINVRWHKRKHQEAQAEWDGWRQIEALGEAQVKYPHITIADGADNRPLKVLLSSLSLKTASSTKGRTAFVCAGWGWSLCACGQFIKKNSSVRAKGVQSHGGY